MRIAVLALLAALAAGPVSSSFLTQTPGAARQTDRTSESGQVREPDFDKQLQQRRDSAALNFDLGAAAYKSRDFAKLRLDAENKKYELGTSQILLVLGAQSDLIAAESNVVVQSVNYRRNVLSLLRTTGELLQERGVAIQ